MTRRISLSRSTRRLAIGQKLRPAPRVPGVTRIVVAGAGAVGASIAYHLALRGASGVVLADRAEVASGQTAKAFGGVRQQFSTAAEVTLARESVGFFEELDETMFQQVGYLFLATTEQGLADLNARVQIQQELGVAVEQVDPARVTELAPGVGADDVLGGVFGPADGLADPAAVTREIVRRAVSLGVEVREQTDVRGIEADVRVIACGPVICRRRLVFRSGPADQAPHPPADRDRAGGRNPGHGCRWSSRARRAFISGVAVITS